MREIFRNKTYLILLLIGIFFIYEPPVDPDFGWHYKYGEIMVHKKEIPKENLFSHTFPNYFWANSYWISQVILYLMYNYLGTVLAGILLALLLSYTTITIIHLAISEKTQQQHPVEVLIGALMLFPFYGKLRVTCRPLFFSTIFLLMLVYILKYRNKLALITPLLFLLWTNMHADFILGLAVLGIYNLHLLYFQGIKKKNLPIHLASITSLATTLINPYGYKLWETLLKETNLLQFSHIGEWLPLSIQDFSIHYYVVASALIIISLIEMKNKKNKVWLILANILFFVASIRSSYFIRIFLILGIFPFTEWLVNISTEFKDLFNKEQWKKISKVSKGTILILFIVLGIKFIQSVTYSKEHKRWAKIYHYPFKSLQYIRKTENSDQFSGDMLNNYDWGGYIIWQMPEQKTFIDGRMPSWRKGNKSIFEDYIKITRTPSENYNLLREYNIDWILIPSDSILANYIREEKNKEWVVNFEDEIAIIFTQIE